MRAIGKIGVVLLALVPLLGWAQSRSGTGDAASRALAQRLESYHTFTADFTQVVVSQNGKEVQKTTGKLKAKRPGLFFWHADPPLEQYIVADGKIVKVYDPDLEQVTIQKMDQRLSSTPALLLSGNVKGLDQAYRITAQGQAGKAARFKLVPRNPDSLFEWLELRFRDGTLEEMRLKDSLGQRSRLRFSHIRINQPVAGSAFKLNLPKGVDVIGGHD